MDKKQLSFVRFERTNYRIMKIYTTQQLGLKKSWLQIQLSMVT